MESFLIHWGYAAVFLFGFLEACCVPIPSAITFAFAGVLAGEGHLSIFGGIVVGTVAELIGSLVSYALGRAGGRALIDPATRVLLRTRPSPLTWDLEPEAPPEANEAAVSAWGTVPGVWGPPRWWREDPVAAVQVPVVARL